MGAEFALKRAMHEGLRIQVVPGDPPILVDRVDTISRDGVPHWVIYAAPERVPLHGGGCQQTTRYVVPVTYSGLRMVA